MSQSNTGTKWDKMAGIGSLLSGIAIVFVALGLVQTNQSIELEKKALSDTEYEQSQSLRPWVGASSEVLHGAYLTDKTFLPAEQFFALQQSDPKKLDQLGIVSIEYDITIKNFGSTPATNITSPFSWTYDTFPTKINLATNFTESPHYLLMPGDTFDLRKSITYQSYNAITETQKMYYIYEIDYDFENGHGYYQQVGNITPDNFNELNVTGK